MLKSLRDLGYAKTASEEAILEETKLLVENIQKENHEFIPSEKDQRNDIKYNSCLDIEHILGKYLYFQMRTATSNLFLLIRRNKSKKELYLRRKNFYYPRSRFGYINIISNLHIILYNII